MFKKKYLGLAIAATLAAANAQAFDAESFTVSGYVKNETAALAKDGSFISNTVTSSGTDSTVNSNRGDLIKSESSVKLFVNGEVGEASTMHAELLLHNDSKAKGSHFKNNDSYTQSEFLRELYVDTTLGDWDLRIGKQQVVWGTADGAKLLGIINPTDYREMAQNTMAESRIPVWMLKADRYLDNGANVQMVISQPRENVFAGLNRSIRTSVNTNNDSNGADLTTAAGHDQGNPFVLRGVDTITGKTNGFLNIVPDLGSVSLGFYGQFLTGLANNPMTVDMFANYSVANILATVGTANQFPNAILAYAGDTDYSGAIDGSETAGLDGTGILAAFASGYDTNLANATSAADWDDAGVTDSTFEYMKSAAFGTFNSFVNAKSQYVFNMPDDVKDSNLSFKFGNTTSNGMNYTANYSYAYDPNPIINLSWRNSSGTELTRVIGSGNVISLHDGTYYYGAPNSTLAASYTIASDPDPILRFEQTLERAHNIGGSLDFAVETESMGPIVIRGEAVYQKGTKQPVIDKNDLAIGDMTEALKMEEADRFKYVLGADVTVMTDMMLSVQFIQDRNLDHINTDSGMRYTASYANMSMTNGFKEAEENQDFYSIFLSKPFGASGEGRWNNILMLEEGGGRWNRFDVEYSLTNNLIGTAEYNKYWGDANTQFGQLEAASNVQVGLKYLFE